MRDPRYRAFNKVTKKMFQVNDLNGLAQNTIVNCEHKGSCECVKTIVCCKHGTACDCMEGIDGYEDEIELMQSVGIKDKDEQELYYDSDIVLLDGSDKKFKAIKDDFDIPVWVADEGALIVDFRDWFLSMPRKSFKIIGNIYQHPHLLKGGDKQTVEKKG